MSSIEWKTPAFRRRLIWLLAILVLSFAVRGLTMRFIHDRLRESAWFQSGSYALFDRQAQNVLDGKASVFWIDDTSKTEAAVYPPGYPMWLAFVYYLSGERSAHSVQRVQWLLDAFSVLLIVGIGVTAYNWRVGLAAGFLAALSPLLALSGATPSADAPTSWIVLAGVWMLLLAYRREKLGWALCAGIAVGASCWLRANGLLLVAFWALALFVLFKFDWRRRLAFSAVVILGAVILVAPLLVRNAIAFRAFVPTGLGMGTNLWEGIGETDRAAEFGAVFGDQALIEQERKALGLPPEAPFTLYFPDGVRRDRERARKAMSVIARNPIWYAGVMGRRAIGMFKYAGKPVPGMGSAGINVTKQKTLGAESNSAIGLVVNVLGMVQSVARWIVLPLAVVGLLIAFRRYQKITVLLLATLLYYLLSLSFMHSELRYGLPMHAILLTWSALALVTIAPMVYSAAARRTSKV
ncbi:MAG TPA: glycosyltransferase family 39 protein [Pyrinomonadaceae bacterium]|nr:glycosyltransferase family 39 protein [Pyrinomonadaceae bacterium]